MQRFFVMIMVSFCCLFISGESGSSELRQMVNEYWRLMIATDYEDVWEMFSAEMKESISKEDFSNTMRMYLKDSPIVKYKIENVKISNYKAIVTMKICYKIDVNDFLEETIYDSWVLISDRWYFNGGGYMDMDKIDK